MISSISKYVYKSNPLVSKRFDKKERREKLTLRFFIIPGIPKKKFWVNFQVIGPNLNFLHGPFPEKLHFRIFCGLTFLKVSLHCSSLWKKKIFPPKYFQFHNLFFVQWPNLRVVNQHIVIDTSNLHTCLTIAITLF